MKVRFSRHASRRAALYKIPEAMVIDMLQKRRYTLGIHELVEFIEGMNLPLKLIIAAEDDIITVVTAYPLKKGHKS